MIEALKNENLSLQKQFADLLAAHGRVIEDKADHVAAAVIREDDRGIRLDKKSRSRQARKIDLAAAIAAKHAYTVTRPYRHGAKACWREERKCIYFVRFVG